MTADERIAELLARAGSPVMVCKNTQESDEEKHNGARAAIERVADEQFHGNVVDYIGHLVDTIDRLEVALHNTLNERDQLLADLLYASENGYTGACIFCVHYYNANNDPPCDMCAGFDEPPCFEWRGVPDEEGEW